MKRVLMLHGYSQNAKLFSQKTGALRKAANKTCEFVFIDAPHILVAPEPQSNLVSIERPQPIVVDDPELQPRAWWRANDERTIYYGVDESLIYLRDFLKSQETPFDIVFGFSQGAAMAALLTVLLEKPSSYRPVPFLDGSSTQPVHPPFKSAIFGSGFAPVHVPLRPLFEETLEGEKPIGSITKTLHVIGTNDPIVTMKRMQSLVDVCVPVNMRVEMHDGGHFIPAKTTWRNFFAAYLASDDPSGIPSPVPPIELADDDRSPRL